jgi:predicted lysophospholipase L1 biosynthesis ABC-type transport system permease subunit
VLIDETLARQYWPNEDPLEQQIQLTSGPTIYNVIGIARHVIGSNLAADSGKGAIYLNLYQMKQPSPVGWVVAKMTGGPISPPAAIRAAVHDVDSSQPVRSITTLADLVAASLAPRTFVSWLLGLFAILALLMAMLGLYGVVSYSVTEQTREFGIRIALGGSRWCVLRSVLLRGVRLAGVGTALGLIGSLLIFRVLRSDLFEVKEFDSLLFLVMAALLLAASLLASYLPARRAVHVDPIVTLRYE